MTSTPMVLAALALAACHARVAASDVPARLTHPTARSHAELLSVVNGALHRETVTIADDALTRESALVIERAPARDALGRPLSGRELGRPERFRLVKHGAACILVHESTGRRYRLAQATCSPE